MTWFFSFCYNTKRR